MFIPLTTQPFYSTNNGRLQRFSFNPRRFASDDDIRKRSRSGLFPLEWPRDLSGPWLLIGSVTVRGGGGCGVGDFVTTPGYGNCR
ncbi:hypothetical protein BaRGS_00030535 [Batillaria attramentaria]|uniref:Uncharacterized protein n=1 Tax=Batillaria attramentaria TaxID=370345 RepID=A0ABD0JUG3_9CAEN